MRFDIHVHTTLSPCSELTLGEILCHSAIRGLDGVCITDHETMGIRHQIKEGPQPDGVCVLFGMEYATPEGDLLLFGPFEEVPPGLSGIEVLQWVRAAGGVAVAAHPFRAMRPVHECLVREGLLDVVEGLNGRNHEDENRRVEAWSSRYGVRQVGGSDVHSLEELGQVVTHFDRPVLSREDLVDVLKTGNYYPEIWHRCGRLPRDWADSRLKVSSVLDI